MQQQILKALLCLCLLVLVTAKKVPTVRQDANLRIGEYLLRSRTAMQRNPGKTVKCFEEYVPKLDELAKAYELQYGECETIAEQNRKAIDEELAGERNELQQTAEGTCKDYEECNGKEGALNFFICYVQAADKSSATSYSLRVAANEAVSSIKHKLETIDYQEERCTNRASDDYIRKSTEVYRDLELCLEGKERPTTPAETTRETIPESTPVTTPETTPVTTPETTPVTTPETTPVTTPETTPVTIPETTPVTIPESTPEEPITVKPEDRLPEEDLSFLRRRSIDNTIRNLRQQGFF